LSILFFIFNSQFILFFKLMVVLLRLLFQVSVAIFFPKTKVLHILLNQEQELFTLGLFRHIPILKFFLVLASVRSKVAYF
jgi:hypothetical protein